MLSSAAMWKGFGSSLLLLLLGGCDSDEPFCGTPPAWHIEAADASEPLTSQKGDPVAIITVTEVEECRPTLALDELYVTFDVPDHSTGKSTRALDEENLLLMELVDDNGNGRLDLHESLHLTEGPRAVVPSGIQWTIWLMFDDGPGEGGAGIDRADIFLD